MLFLAAKFWGNLLHSNSWGGPLRQGKEGLGVHWQQDSRSPACLQEGDKGAMCLSPWLWHHLTASPVSELIPARAKCQG